MVSVRWADGCAASTRPPSVELLKATAPATPATPSTKRRRDNRPGMCPPCRTRQDSYVPVHDWPQRSMNRAAVQLRVYTVAECCQIAWLAGHTKTGAQPYNRTVVAGFTCGSPQPG